MPICVKGSVQGRAVRACCALMNGPQMRVQHYPVHTCLCRATSSLMSNSNMYYHKSTDKRGSPMESLVKTGRVCGAQRVNKRECVLWCMCVYVCVCVFVFARVLYLRVGEGVYGGEVHVLVYMHDVTPTARFIQQNKYCSSYFVEDRECGSRDGVRGGASVALVVVLVLDPPPKYNKNGYEIAEGRAQKPRQRIPLVE